MDGEPLDRFLARRLVIAVGEARRRIQWGRISIDGVRCQHYHVRLCNGQQVVADGVVVDDGPDHSVLVYHKPRGLACSHDPDDAPLIYDAVPECWRHPNLHSCGRLDRDTSGLLILTSDGRVTRALAEPSAKVGKRYEVGYSGTLVADAQHQAASGMMLDGEEKILLPARLSVDAAVSCTLSEADRRHVGPLPISWCTLDLDEGRHHQVKRMIRQWGGRVVRLHRVRIGGFSLPSDLMEGEMRPIDRALLGIAP